MSRAFDFTVVSVVWVVCVVVRYMGLVLLQPGTPLYAAATDGTEQLGGPAFASVVWQSVAIWIPMIAIAGILAWATLREYKRQSVTATRPV